MIGSDGVRSGSTYDVNEALRRAGQEVEQTRAAHRAAIAARDDLIAAAVRSGLSQRRTASAVGVSLSLVSQVLLARGAGTDA